MWQEIQNAIVDPGAATGLRASFIENLSAEFVGVFLGIIISFLAAFILDKVGNERQFRPLRHRLAQKLVAIHDEMHRKLVPAFAHGADNAAPIRAAIKDAQEIVEAFDFGLTHRQMSMVDAYRLKLREFEDYASNLQKKTIKTEEYFDEARRLLKPALKSLHHGRLERHWLDVLGQSLSANGLAEQSSAPNPIYAFFARANASRSESPSQ